MKRTVELICPHDSSMLDQQVDHLHCNQCQRIYPIEDGVARLLDENDEFYEGAYENQVRFLPKSEESWHIWPLWLVNSGYPWLVRKYVPEKSTVVELGCAGGVRYFGSRYRMIGCDLSFSSLKKLDGYTTRVQCDATQCIPLPDASVDSIVSSYFWEHIEPDIKPLMLREFHRVLRPSGKIIFVYDVETQNPLIRRYKNKDQGLYQKLFLEGDGHVGYESPEDNITHFEQAGFKIVRHQGMEKTWLQSQSVYQKLSSYPGRWQSLNRGMARLGRQPWFYPYTGLMRITDTLVCPWLPADRARIDMVVAEKN